MPKKIDLTPTWYHILPTLVLLLASKDKKAVQTAKEELNRMAHAADKYNRIVKKGKSK